MKPGTVEIPCYLFDGIKFSDRQEALKEMEERATDLGLPRGEREIFCVVVRHIIDKACPIKVSEIADRVRKRKRIRPIEPKNIHPLVKRLCAKGLLRIVKRPPIEVEPGGLSDLNYFWFREHYFKQKKAFDALSTVATLLNLHKRDSGGDGRRMPPEHYDNDSDFLLCLYHALFSASKSILVVANYFSALLEFPLIGDVLRKKKADGVNITVVVKRESRAIPELKELEVDLRILTTDIPCRVMISDQRSLFVNLRYEGGERVGAYYENDKKQVNRVWDTWVKNVLETSERIE